MSWFDSLVGLWGPDAALRFALGQGPNQPGGGGPSPLMTGTDPNAAAPIPLTEWMRPKRRIAGGEIARTICTRPNFLASKTTRRSRCLTGPMPSKLAIASRLGHGLQGNRLACAAAGAQPGVGSGSDHRAAAIRPRQWPRCRNRSAAASQKPNATKTIRALAR